MDRFWKRVQKTVDCWLWLSGAGTYGWFSYQGKAQGAHRVAWMLTYGPIPKGLYVLHRCDNPRCVRPDHLFLGTQSENIKDMWSKGRGAQVPLAARARGERHGMARLTEKQVLEIRGRHREGLSYTKLAKQYGVGRTTIYEAVRGIKWKHLGKPLHAGPTL